MSEGPRKRFRFKLRSLLVVVALVAMSLGLLRHFYLSWAGELVHAQMAAAYSQAAFRAHGNIAWSNFQVDGFPSERNRKLETRYSALSLYHQELSEKCRRARWRPWVAIESDPEPPAEAGP